MIAAVILAAGASTRLGRPKQLLPFRSETLIRRAARAAMDSGCGQVAVVLGHAAAEIAAELSRLPVEMIPNEAWPEGLASSIRTGVRAASAADAILLLTCDQPFADASQLRALLAAHAANPQPITASAYGDTLGIPAIFDRIFFPQLLTLKGDQGAKPLLREHREKVAVHPFPAGLIDLDTPADYEQLLEAAAAEIVAPE